MYFFFVILNGSLQVPAFFDCLVRATIKLIPFTGISKMSKNSIQGEFNFIIKCFTTFCCLNAFQIAQIKNGVFSIEFRKFNSCCTRNFKG